MGGTRSYDGGRAGEASATGAGGRSRGRRRELEKAAVHAANGL